MPPLIFDFLFFKRDSFTKEILWGRRLNLESLPKWAGVSGAPKIEKLISSLCDVGYSAARIPDIEPLLATDAPFEIVLEQVREHASSSK